MALGKPADISTLPYKLKWWGKRNSKDILVQYEHDDCCVSIWLRDGKSLEEGITSIYKERRKVAAQLRRHKK